MIVIIHSLLSEIIVKANSFLSLVTSYKHLQILLYDSTTQCWHVDFIMPTRGFQAMLHHLQWKDGTLPACMLLEVSSLSCSHNTFFNY